MSAEAPSVPPGAPASPIAAIGWAFFLASSWTWCIGMFLPVLLAEDFGVVGWIAFAIPNVLGAAAVGVLARTAQERVEAPAFDRWALAFSLATIAFHVAFLAWITPRVFTLTLAPTAASAAGVAAAALLAGGALLLARLRDRGMNAAAIAVYALSLACLLLAALMSEGRAFAVPPALGDEPAWALLAVAPALAFGFLLCPQLDLTLLRTRRATAGATRALTFALGFGVLFLAMIVASLLYAGGWIRGWINLWIFGHFTAQSFFTLAAQLREIRDGPFSRGFARWSLGAIILGLLTGLAANLDGDAGRLVYEGFLGLYAIVFPVFVWTLLAGLGARAGARLMRGALLTIAVAAPLFAVGHLTRAWWLLGLGLGLALALPPALRARRSASIA